MIPVQEKRKILFICTHNATRSQIAEGYMRSKYGDRFDVYSAGLTPAPVNPMTIEVMKEIGIDISGQISKPVDIFFGRDMGTVVTVCDEATKVCPFFPGAKEVINQNFPDPSKFTGSPDEIRSRFRLLRDEITRWIDETFSAS